eukprot:scaffold27022_cov78-Skeletonema_dohrnii-CCMP3373.AAC.1
MQLTATSTSTYTVVPTPKYTFYYGDYLKLNTGIISMDMDPPPRHLAGGGLSKIDSFANYSRQKSVR